MQGSSRASRGAVRAFLLRAASLILAVVPSAGQASPDSGAPAAGGTQAAFLAAGAAVPVPVLGDGDAFVETNEAWSLTVPLTNTGGVAAAAISGAPP